ncbi:MAG TPA: cupin domain-containing protein [Geopsychrobacteraceae bacterium]|jgi:quercetin dioxygenase-like cupin family protein
MAKLIDSNLQEWEAVRPELTEKVTGKVQLDGPTRMVLTRVRPGGMFRPHRDNYRHLFHILSGRGLFRVDAREYELSAGMTLQVEAGALHSYENRGQQDLLLISLNLSRQG